MGVEIALLGRSKQLRVPNANDAVVFCGRSFCPMGSGAGSGGFEVGSDGGEGGEIVAGEGEFGEDKEVGREGGGGGGEESGGAGDVGGDVAEGRGELEGCDAHGGRRGGLWMGGGVFVGRSYFCYGSTVSNFFTTL